MRGAGRQHRPRGAVGRRRRRTAISISSAVKGVFLNDGTHFFSAAREPLLPLRPDGARRRRRGRRPWTTSRRYSGGTRPRHPAPRGTRASSTSRSSIHPQQRSILINRPTLADLDDDGDLDIAVNQGPAGSAITIYANSGGTFAQSTVIPVPTLTGNRPSRRRRGRRRPDRPRPERRLPHAHLPADGPRIHVRGAQGLPDPARARACSPTSTATGTAI